jgi:hypothetical protein
MPGTPIELPQVEMKPVTATVIVVLHLLDFDQLRGFAGEVEKVARMCAASFAEAEVSTVVDFASGEKGVGGTSTFGEPGCCFMSVGTERV